jgi:hypothetical protein
VWGEKLAEGDLEFDVGGFFLATEPGAEDLVALGGGEGGFDAFAHGIAIGAFAEFFVLKDDKENAGGDGDGFGDGAWGDELGFADEQYFSRFFTKMNGVPPARYRQRLLSGY